MVSQMAITMTQLRSFLAVVETGSVTAAAEELYVTQPSVSAAVSALSKEVGADLTVRLGRSVEPSAAGKAFAPYAAHVIGLLDQGGRAAREGVAGGPRPGGGRGGGGAPAGRRPALRRALPGQPDPADNRARRPARE